MSKNPDRLTGYAAHYVSGRFVHPLREIGLAAFDDGQCHDAITLAVYFGAPNRPPSAPRAYRNLAEDLLGLLSEEGLIRRDGAGWYWRLNAVAK